jgi:hypothetical protein
MAEEPNHKTARDHIIQYSLMQLLYKERPESVSYKKNPSITAQLQSYGNNYLINVFKITNVHFVRCDHRRTCSCISPQAGPTAKHKQLIIILIIFYINFFYTPLFVMMKLMNPIVLFALAYENLPFSVRIGHYLYCNADSMGHFSSWIC